LPWPILRLAAGLQRHNRTAPASRQLRLRVAMHAGEVVRDAHGYTGKDLNLAFRLLNAHSLRSHLAGARTSLVLVISDSIYNDIVVQGHGHIGPDAFQPIPITGKNVHAQAWMYLPGRHPGPAARRGGPTEPIAAPTVPRELPTDAHHFTGREVELEWLLATLRQTGGVATTVVALHGVGGVGKSALAVHAAHLLAAEFPDGQLYVNLQGATAGLDPLATEVVVGRLLRALGVDGRDIPADLDEAATRLRSRMAGRRILLVLDNAVSATQVRPRSRPARPARC